MQLRELAELLTAELPDSLKSGDALDVEFGFRDGELVLFQVRPLVERGGQRADRLVESLRPPARSVAATVELNRPPSLAPTASGS